MWTIVTVAVLVTIADVLFASFNTDNPVAVFDREGPPLTVGVASITTLGELVVAPTLRPIVSDSEIMDWREAVALPRTLSCPEAKVSAPVYKRCVTMASVSAGATKVVLAATK